MGFYGNISNSAKTNMSFDKIYPNRKTMEENMTSDGVYVGRFVLIEYDDATTVWRQAFTNNYDSINLPSTILYSDNACSVPYSVSADVVGESYGLQYGDIVFIVNETTGYYDYYECIGKTEPEGYALFTFLKVSDQIAHDNSYIVNYNIDRKYYANNIGRGWDSTVWQKVYDNGVEKYAMIAELNSVVPTFSLEADPPTTTPIPPHFDSNSNNMYYNLHWQPTWGLRIKSSKKYETPLIDANGNQLTQTTSSTHDVGSTAYQKIGTIPSDIDMKWSKTALKPDGYLANSWFKLDENNQGKGTWVENPDEATALPAAIYFNKDGFDPKKISYSPGFDPDKFVYTANNTNNANNTVTDMIVMEPTGRSGLIYQSHNNLDYNSSEDIQEFSVMLPTIGNVIAKAWDMIYCDSSQAVERKDKDGNTYYERKVEYSWSDGNDPQRSGARLFTIADNGIPEYNQRGANSIAGCINSVHDLMGMIIVHNGENMPDVNNADENKIYYVQGDEEGYRQGYYRKKRSFEWDTNNLNSFEEIKLQAYDKNKAYYFKEGVNYTKAKNEKDQRKYYYFEDFEKDFVSVNLDGAFESNKYYYKDSSTGYIKYILYKGLEPQPNVQYYEVNTKEVIYQRFYIPRTYFFNNSNNEFEVDNNDHPTQGRIYYTRDIVQDEETLDFKYTYKRINEELHKFDPTEDPLFTLENETYVQLRTAPEEVIPLYRLEVSSDNTNFYAKNTYYIQDAQGNLIYCGDKEYDERADYYKMVKLPVEVPYKFYQANKYYYQSSPNNYVIDKNANITQDRIYYTQGYIYVKEDTLGIIPSGSIWHGDRDNPPSNIILAVKRDKYIMEPLPEFASVLNTLNGLILKMNTMLEFGDESIRDTETAQGCINVLKDIIFKFESLNPGDLMIVDNYGRMYGAPVNNDQWVKFNVTNTLTDSSISFSHSSSGVSKGSYGESSAKSVTFGNSFNIPSYTVDEAGHITASNNIAITIPDPSGVVLKNYSLDLNSPPEGGVNNSDTINQAFAKLQAQIAALTDEIISLQEQVLILSEVAGKE